jgi:PhnB protein
MAEIDLIERLDEAIDAILAGDLLTDVAEPELAMLALVASDLRGLPDPQFKRQLKGRILPMTTTTEVRIPPGLTTVTPYLAGEGAAKLIDFLESAFGAQVEARVPRPEDPAKIMHSEILIGDSRIELGDVSNIMDARRFELHLYVEDADATYARAMEAGARSLHAPMDQPYGDREGGIEDPMGNYWYIATHGKEIRPAGFRSITPFLHATHAPELIDFLKKTFDAQEGERVTTPEGSIAYTSLTIGGSPIELAAAHGQWQPMPAGLHVFVDDADRVYQRALAAGAKELFAPSDAPYGQRIGGVVDGEGNRWYIATVL